MASVTSKASIIKKLSVVEGMERNGCPRRPLNDGGVGLRLRNFEATLRNRHHRTRTPHARGAPSHAHIEPKSWKSLPVLCPLACPFRRLSRLEWFWSRWSERARIEMQMKRTRVTFSGCTNSGALARQPPSS